MIKKRLLLFSLILFLFPLCAEAEELQWAGCGISKKAFMKELASAYKAKTGTTINLKGGGATKGIRLTAAAKTDIGGACRFKLDRPEENNTLMHHVAWDAIVFIVHKDSPVDNITTQQIKDIFTGAITNWKELEAPEAPIKLLIRKGKISGVGLTLRELVFGNPDQEFTSNAEVRKSTGPIEVEVSRDINAFGASGNSSAQRRKGIKRLKVDGIAPTKENIMAGTYPFYRPLYIVTRQEMSDQVRQFIDYALSPYGQEVIAAQGTVNLAEGMNLKSAYKGRM